MQSVFRWGGEYFGFEDRGYIHTATGKTVAFVSAGAVWRLDGAYLGEWMPEGYVLRPHRTDRPLRLTPRVLSVPPVLPPRPARRPPRHPKRGWTDALSAF